MNRKSFGMNHAPGAVQHLVALIVPTELCQLTITTYDARLLASKSFLQGQSQPFAD